MRDRSYRRGRLEIGFTTADAATFADIDSDINISHSLSAKSVQLALFFSLAKSTLEECDSNKALMLDHLHFYLKEMWQFNAVDQWFSNFIYRVPPQKILYKVPAL
jgi:hypothetical protein